MNMRALIVGLTVLVAAGIYCGGDPQEATRHEMPVATDGTTLTGFENDLGYQIDLESVFLSVERVEFTVGGQSHASSRSLKNRLARWVLPTARAHPNHAAGGEVGGELVGPLVLHWRPGEVEKVGDGNFLGGDYAGYNLVMGRGVPQGEAGSTMQQSSMARLVGVASKDGQDHAFDIEIGAVDDGQVFGGAFAGRIPDESATAAGLTFLPFDDWSKRSIFDGVDFAELPVDEESNAYLVENSLEYVQTRLALLSHEHYGGGMR